MLHNLNIIGMINRVDRGIAEAKRQEGSPIVFDADGK